MNPVSLPTHSSCSVFHSQCKNLRLKYQEEFRFFFTVMGMLHKKSLNVSSDESKRFIKQFTASMLFLELTHHGYSERQQAKLFSNFDEFYKDLKPILKICTKLINYLKNINFLKTIVNSFVTPSQRSEICQTQFYYEGKLQLAFQDLRLGMERFSKKRFSEPCMTY